MTASENPLSGTAALVSGASSGLGRAAAARLGEAGADVALLGRSRRGLAAACSEVAAHGVRALPLGVDLADSDGLSVVVEQAATQLGGLGILVNAAGTDVPGTAQELTVPDWQHVLAVNLTAPFALARAVMPHMRRRGGGLIVNISSVAGRRGWAKSGPASSIPAR